MRLCSYVLKKDSGLAPNPFWGYCTLAICTPNHMGIKAQKGDWIVGTGSSEQGNKLIYAMQISEVLHFDEYYNDPRFEKKKPVMNGDWKQNCGDNMYYWDKNMVWQQHPTRRHCEKADKDKDLKHPYVFISEHFFYFGEKAIKIPFEFDNLIWRRQGVKGEHDPKLVENFLNWLNKSFKPGIHGEPRNREKE